LRKYTFDPTVSWELDDYDLDETCEYMDWSIKCMCDSGCCHSQDPSTKDESKTIKDLLNSTAHFWTARCENRHYLWEWTTRRRILNPCPATDYSGRDPLYAPP